MIIFFYGEDGYRSFQKLHELKTRYIDASLGDTNLSHHLAAELEPDVLANSLLAFPFLAKTRLVIIENLLSKGAKPLQEKFLDLMPKIPESTVALVYESGLPDRRTQIFKTLVKQAKSQEFAPLAGLLLERWIEEFLTLRTVKIGPVARQELIIRLGGNSWRLATELEKLATYLADEPVEEREITPDHVELLVRSAPMINVFQLTDALVSGNQASTFKQLSLLLEQGENSQYLIALLASSIRTLALIRDALDRGLTSSTAIAAHTNLKPFVISKHLASAKKLTSKTVAQFFQALSNLDLKVKRGMMDADTGLELFVVQRFCQA
ncbi:DNA polymerase III subunit delta [Candidatus Berkelbacteria bacterium]|nr:DNA polymerase III subunit delta [Candidatus Berkelbacteria bacterium]